MKKSANNMDQLFKEQFQGAQAPLNADQLWSAVEGQLPEEQPKGYWMYSLIGLVISMLLLAVYLWPTSSSGMASASSDSTTNENPEQMLTGKSATPVVEIAQTLPQKETNSTESETNRIVNERLDLNTSPSFTPYGKRGTEESSQSAILSKEDDNITARESSTHPSGPVAPLNVVTSFFAERPNPSLLIGPDPDWSRCSDRRNRVLGFFIDAYGFAGYPLISTSLNADQSIDYSDFSSQWVQGESAVSTFSGGLMIGLELPSGLSLSAGVEFQQIQNKINRDQTIIERITIYDEMAYYYLDSNNNRVYVADSVTTTRTFTRSVQSAKTHTLINLPVLLAYHQRIGNFRYGIIGGVNIHLQNEFTGKVLDPSGQIIDADSDMNTAVYRTKMDMSFIGGLDLGYMTNEWLELYISPRFRYQPGSWLNAAHPLESRMQFLGMQAGLRLHL